MNRKGFIQVAWFVLAAVVAFVLLVWSSLGIWGLVKFMFAPIGKMGPVGIAFIALIIILILRRQ